MPQVKIGNSIVGDGAPCYIVGEIGINHNGDLGIAKRLIDVSAIAGANAVKFQKRTIEVVYSADELGRPRENPFGATNGDLKRGLEFGLDQYRTIDRYCSEKGIAWFASCWDEASVDFMEQFNPPAYKIASASLTDDNLLRHHRRTGRPIIVSTGMSTMAQVDHAVSVLGSDNLVLLHTTSAYPAKIADLNLRMIPTLRERYGVPVGYSGHEVGLASTFAAVALGACMVERHITLDRAMWGSDQAASVEPQGLMKLVRDIRVIEESLGDGVKKVTADEVPIMKKLRRVG
ncbi:MAG TPA: N-acetylneuraminate synthase family protein [Polyangiaceae bacterium]|nr:N-acetylneuraminate synthase family protein [Polyangiaceae bacterium]